MFSASLILKQLEYANTLAKSNLHYDVRMSLILLDNLVEVVLKSHAESDFSSDRPYWFDGFKQKYNRRYRSNVFSFFDELLKHSFNVGIITAEEQVALKFAHRVRNETYHKNSHNHGLTLASVKVLMSILRTNLSRWKTGNSLYEISSEKNLFFDDDFDISKDEAWEKIVLEFTDFIDVPGPSVSLLLADELRGKCLRLEKNLKFLSEDLEGVDLNAMNIFICHPFNRIKLPSFGPRKKKLKRQFLLQFYSFVGQNRGNYKDSTDAIEMGDLIDKLVLYMKTKDRKLAINLRMIKRSIEELEGLLGVNAIDHFVNVHSRISPLYEASNEASSALDGYIQFLIDEARGK